MKRWMFLEGNHGGQFAPAQGGQFESATHGQFKSAEGGQFDRSLQSQPGYAKIESGLTENISLSVAVKISNVLGIGFNELYDIDGDSQKIDGQNKEIETLKKRIAELEEQLNDKRKIIEHLTNDDFAPGFARFLRNKEGVTIPEKRDFNDYDALIRELEESEKLDYNAKEFIVNYFKSLKRS